MPGELWRGQVRAGKETTYGTAVTATRRLYLMEPVLTREREGRPKKFATATRDNVRAHTLGPQIVGGSVRMPMSADELLEWLLVTLKGAVTPTTPSGATNGRDWTFTPNPTLDSMTLEWDDGARPWRATGIYGNTLTVEGSVDGEANVSLDLFGSAMTQNALTGSPTERVPTFSEGWESRVYLGVFGEDPLIAAPINALLVNWNVAVNNNLVRKYYAENANQAQAVTIGELDITARLLFEASAAQALTEFNNWDAQTKRLVRLVLGANEAITGDTAVNEVQSLTTSGTPTGGTFTLKFRGQTTSAIVFNATAAAVQSALEALSTIGTGNIAASGGPLPTAITLTFQGTLAGQELPLITRDANNLTGGASPDASVSQTTNGYMAKRAVWIDIPGAWGAFDHGQTNEDTRAYELTLNYVYDPTFLAAGLRVITRNNRTTAF